VRGTLRDAARLQALLADLDEMQHERVSGSNAPPPPPALPPTPTPKPTPHHHPARNTHAHSPWPTHSSHARTTELRRRKGSVAENRPCPQVVLEETSKKRAELTQLQAEVSALLDGPGGNGLDLQRVDAKRFSSAADDLLRQLDTKLSRRYSHNPRHRNLAHAVPRTHTLTRPPLTTPYSRCPQAAVPEGEGRCRSNDDRPRAQHRRGEAGPCSPRPAPPGTPTRSQGG
jgi:hypothetical protein